MPSAHWNLALKVGGQDAHAGAELGRGVCGGVKGTASAAWVLNFPEENNYTRLGSCSWQRQLPEELPWVRESEPEMWAAGPPHGSWEPCEDPGKGHPRY